MKALTDINAILTAEECAAWLRLSLEQLWANVRRGKIPAMRVNARTLRFHPATILQHLDQTTNDIRKA